MPVFRGGEAPPDWCELREFDVLELAEGQGLEQRRRQPKERLLVTAGTVQLRLAEGSVVLKESQFFDLPSLEAWEIVARSPRAQLVRLSGRWGRDVGGCGIFRATHSDRPTDKGDPVAYPKTTTIDSHYHDCDEYWIILEGSGTVVIDDRRLAVSVGDCVPVGMGHRHDFPTVASAVKSVFFETTLEGRARVGHLWVHTHGPAEPKPERI